jgi:ribosomal protein S12 methylthiotransferase accessory factor
MGSQIVLKDSYKSYTYDQDKAASPEQTVNMVKQRFAEANLNILKHTVRIDSGRLDIPVFISICGSDAFQTIGTKKQMGKGATPTQAEASALMELAERYSFFSYLRNRHFISTTYPDLDQPAMDLDNILRSVHHDPGDAERANAVFRKVPLSWTWARNLTREQDVLAPLNWFYEINQFNGPSAGNTLEEAIVQGACEVVERHVSELVSSRELLTPHIDLDSVQSEAARQLIQNYKKAGIRLWVKDFTMGMGIPSIGALAWDPSTFPQRSEIVFTAGTAPDPEKALIRALTEVAQLAGDFDTGGSYVASGLPKPKSLDEVGYITDDYSKISIQSMPSIAHPNLRVEVANCVEALRRNDLELFVISVTHPLLGIPAVYTIIPGCRFRERARNSSIPFFSSKIICHTLPPERALQDLNWMSTIYPECYYIEFYKGLIAMELGVYDEALQRFRKALELDPEAEDAPTIQCQVGLCYRDLGEFARAIAELEKAAILDGERKEVHSALGYCYFKLNRHLESIDCFQKAIELDPGSAIDYANIGSNLRELGRVEEALRLYKMALELDSSIEFARENIRLLRQKREPQQA